MLRLKLYPNEFRGLMEFLTARLKLLLMLEPMSRSIYDQVLVEYWHKARLLDKLAAWQMRNSRQRYSLPVPLSVGRVLHQEMQHVELTIYGQAFLATLDQCLTNEIPQNVYAWRH
ncbi:hypothetical protein ACS5NO_12625 [Larkinella sp. GY13]|uniref:hypothetical protein n=1 Tax=Larkinella sp. GY13 TaxID=3453720 RepID=UPI003EEE06EF